MNSKDDGDRKDLKNFFTLRSLWSSQLKLLK